VTDKQRKTVTSIGIFFIVLVGLFTARAMLENSSIPKNYGKPVFTAIWIMAIIGWIKV
jgi:hypothetical protein